jgi:glutamyl-tRNA reductase
MSVLVVGLSHRSAPVELLEATAIGPAGVGKLLLDAFGGEHVDEAFVLATCNRLEVYAEVRKFHAGVQEVTERVVSQTGVPLDDLTGHLYVHYEDRAVQHLFAVAAGLDSMVVGEQQILGQLRDALQLAREEGTVARSLGGLAEHALHAGKRVHAETGIDKAGRSVVSVGLDLAAERLGDLARASAVVVGAGSMSSLAATTLRRRGVAGITVVNRTPARAERLAAAIDGTARPASELAAALAEADVVVSCTGATGTVVPADVVRAAMQGRAHRPLFLLDLALPRDVDPEARAVPGVHVVDLESLRTVLEGAEVERDVDAARRLVNDEVAAYLTKQRTERVTPTVAALRARAQEVVDGELARLFGRLPDLDDRVRREVAAAVGRVVDKLLHAPTVRVKELAGSPDGESYATVLRELFAVDPAAAEAVARADVVLEDGE